MLGVSPSVTSSRSVRDQTTDPRCDRSHSALPVGMEVTERVNAISPRVGADHGEYGQARARLPRARDRTRRPPGRWPPSSPGDAADLRGTASPPGRAPERRRPATRTSKEGTSWAGSPPGPRSVRAAARPRMSRVRLMSSSIGLGSMYAGCVRFRVATSRCKPRAAGVAARRAEPRKPFTSRNGHDRVARAQRRSFRERRQDGRIAIPELARTASAECGTGLAPHEVPVGGIAYMDL